MQREIKFAVEEIKRIEFSDYEEQEYSIARLGFISTRPNSHEIGISEDVLRASAPSVLGKWIVADVQWGDATTHTDAEHIVGIVPKDQEVEFVEDDDGYLRAYVDGIISKRYAADFCDIFAKDNERAVSIEAKFEMTDDENASAFDIKGVTVLGKAVRPSCPESDITFVRFSEQDAEACYSKWHDAAGSVWSLRKFVEERKQSMADDKKLKVDKSKDAMSETAWGDVDKSALRDKIMVASNRASLVKSAYMLVEDGWEDAPSEHLKYPVMEIKGDTLVYNRYGLASALAYAKQEGEDAVVNKIEKIYKKLDLDSEGKEEKMAMEIEFTAVNISDLWGLLWNAIGERHWEYGIQGVYEEDNKKFAILSDRDQKLYRLDFSLTEDGLTAADKVVEVKQEFTETDNIKKFAEPENVADYRFAAEPKNDPEPEPDDKGEEKMSEDEMMAKIDQLTKDIEDRDHIIMEKDAELDKLREFQTSVFEKERAKTVESVMCDIKDYVDALTYNDLREEGMACKFDEVDGWANKAKALCFGAVKKSRQKANLDTTVWSFAAPVEPVKKTIVSIWD